VGRITKLIKKNLEFILISTIIMLLGRLCFLENEQWMLVIELVCTSIVLIMTGVSKDVEN
jgi:hypothetical protein